MSSMQWHKNIKHSLDFETKCISSVSWFEPLDTEVLQAHTASVYTVQTNNKADFVQTELRRAMTTKEEEMRNALEVERDLRQELLRQVSSSTDKKEIKFSSYIWRSRMEQLQSHIWRRASYYMIKCLNISPYMKRPLFIYDFATARFWISFYMRKIWFLFLSVYCSSKPYDTVACQPVILKL